MGKIDLTSMVGKRFGRLLVIERDLDKPRGHGQPSYWICKCDCGNTISVSASNLTRGKTLSCGCYRSELVSQKNTKDITNKKYGLLTAIKNTMKKNNHNCYIWLCECACGNTCYYSVEDLQSKKIVSCGCKHKPMGEITIENILIENNISYKSQFSFFDLKSDIGYPLRYDFAIFDENNNLIRLIEFDGQQHYDKNSKFYSDRLILLDNLKNNYAKEHNIPLIRIPYWELKNLSLEMLLSNKYLI